MDAITKEVSEEEYEAELNDIYGDVNICGYTYPAGFILKQIDETAFRCGIADKDVIYICGQCGDEYDTEEEAEACCTDSE